MSTIEHIKDEETIHEAYLEIEKEDDAADEKYRFLKNLYDNDRVELAVKLVEGDLEFYPPETVSEWTPKELPIDLNAYEHK